MPQLLLHHGVHDSEAGVLTMLNSPAAVILNVITVPV